MELWSALASARDSHFVPSRRRRVGVVRLHVLLSPLPSSLAWRRPRGFARVQGRGRTLAGAARITPPGVSPAGEVAPPAVRPAIEALRATTCTRTAYPPKTWSPSARRFLKSPRGPTASTTPTSSLTLPQRGRNQATGRGGFTLKDGESRGERAPSRRSVWIRCFTVPFPGAYRTAISGAPHSASAVSRRAAAGRPTSRRRLCPAPRGAGSAFPTCDTFGGPERRRLADLGVRGRSWVSLRTKPGP